MADRFLRAVRLPSHLRTALLICAVALGFVLGLGTAVFSSHAPPYVLQADGVMMPDNTARPTETPPGGPERSTNKSYSKATTPHYTWAQAAGTTTISRNGQPWVTITQKKGSIDLSDPSGTPHNASIITIYPKH